MTTTTIAVSDPALSEGLKSQPTAGTYTLVSLTGAGVFLGGRVAKNGGNSDLTFVNLEIDGHSIVNMSFSGAVNSGLTQPNPFGLMVLQSGSYKTFTFGFPTPLAYKTSLRLMVTVSEPNITQIIGTVIRGAA